MKYESKIFNKSSIDMSEIDSETVHLIVTSPPYNAKIEYDEYDDKKTYQEYIVMMRVILKECFRVLVPGGRICVNIANIGRSPYRPMRSLINELLDKSGFSFRGEIIWQKWNNASTTAWGSYLSASNPYLRDVHEYIIVASKTLDKMKPPHDHPVMDITKDEWLKYTNSIWKILPKNSKKHPAIYPNEIPKRLIKLFTWRDCVVLDPFCGIGTTLKVAKELKRYGIGYEISSEYFKQMEIIKEQSSLDDFELESYWENHFLKIDQIEEGEKM